MFPQIPHLVLQTTAGDFDWYEKTTNCQGGVELRREPNIFRQSATTGEREAFHNIQCQANGHIELGTKITNESLLIAGITSVKSSTFT